MNATLRKSHWENIYSTKSLNEVSWHEPKPDNSIKLIEKYALNKNVAIIDIGGGDSFLADNLIALGYSNITVLDISETAIEKAKIRLGENATKIKWIVSDITSFEPTEKYDIWHDRAVFHFLTNVLDQENYKELLINSLKENGIFIIGTFAIDGPTKCSGITVQQYDIESITTQFTELELVENFNFEHPTPFNTFQKFIFAVFKK